MSKSIYKPYVYLIGWSNYNTYYYGVRYAKDCFTSELWESYFTSSKYVHQFYRENGSPDIIQIRRIFDNVKSACDWEDKVLRRMNVVKDIRFLNRTDNRAIVTDKQYNRQANLVPYLESVRGKTHIEIFGEERAKLISKKLSEKTKERWKNPFYKKVYSEKPKDTSNYKKSAEKRWANPSFKSKMKSKKWMKKEGQNSKMVSPELWEKFILEGWSFGRS